MAACGSDNSFQQQFSVAGIWFHFSGDRGDVRLYLTVTDTAGGVHGTALYTARGSGPSGSMGDGSCEGEITAEQKKDSVSFTFGEGSACSLKFTGHFTDYDVIAGTLSGTVVNPGTDAFQAGTLDLMLYRQSTIPPQPGCPPTGPCR
jgi:hypothetical protein